MRTPPRTPILLINVWELVRGRSRKCVLAKLKGPLPEGFVFEANCETERKKITMLVDGGLDLWSLFRFR